MSQQVELITASTEGNALLPPLIRAFQRVSAAPLFFSHQAFFNSCILDHLLKSIDSNIRLVIGGGNAGRMRRAGYYAEQANTGGGKHSFEDMMSEHLRQHIAEQRDILTDFAERLARTDEFVPRNISTMLTAAVNFNAEQDTRRAHSVAKRDETNLRARMTPLLDIAVDAHFCAHLMDYLGTRMRDRWAKPEQAAQYRNFLMLIRDRLPMTIDPSRQGNEMHLTIAHESINAMRDRLRYILRQDDEAVRIPQSAYDETRLANWIVNFAAHYGEVYTFHEATPRPGNIASLDARRHAKPA